MEKESGELNSREMESGGLKSREVESGELTRKRWRVETSATGGG